MHSPHESQNSPCGLECSVFSAGQGLSEEADLSVKNPVHLSVLLLVCVSDRLGVGGCVHEIVRP